MSENDGSLSEVRALEAIGVVCEQCDWRYFAPGDGTIPDVSPSSVCPHCGSARLIPLDRDAADHLYSAPPELVVPFGVSEAKLAQQIATFASGIPYAPPDLTATALRHRLQRLYLPMWLVDVDVTTQWGAEVGFNYEVVSHQERYADGAGWRTAEVRETRVRWEPRVGTLERHYDNTAAPALETQAALQRVLGSFDLAGAEPYRPESLGRVLIRMPDRPPQAAWPDAAAALQERAARECQIAAEADHIRSYRWSPAYTDPAWTLLLLPVLAAAYLDDDGAPQRVLIHGQTGQVYGARRGSMKRAQRVSLITGLIALAIFAIGLVLALLSLLLPPLLVVGIAIALAAIPVGIGAIFPIARVWSYNRKQADVRMEV